MSVTCRHTQFVNEISEKMLKCSIEEMPRYILALKEQVKNANSKAEASIIQKIIISKNFLEVFPIFLSNDFTNMQGKWKMIESVVDFGVYCAEGAKSEDNKFEREISALFAEVLNLIERITTDINSFPESVV